MSIGVTTIFAFGKVEGLPLIRGYPGVVGHRYSRTSNTQLHGNGIKPGHFYISKYLLMAWQGVFKLS
jgi:hypothetical protein